MFYILSVLTSAALLAYIIGWSLLQTFNTNPTKRFMRIWVKLLLYYAAYTMPIWSVLLVVGWCQAVRPAWASLSVSSMLLAITIMGAYFYSAVVQPNRLRVAHHEVDLNVSTPLTVAILADLRVGIYSGKPRHIRKLVATINALSADAVLITGDWLYYPHADLVGQLMLFKAVNKPIYTVMSTSDLCYLSANTTKQGQPLLEDTLASAFAVLDINYIGQQCLPLSLSAPHPAGRRSDNKNCVTQKEGETNSVIATLCGWQDLPQKPIDTEVLNCAAKQALSAKIATATEPVIILASRLDSLRHLPKSLQPRPLLITGAAKTTQTYPPQRHKKTAAAHGDRPSAVLKTSRLSKQQGLYQHSSAQIFVSCGIGTRGLPFRWYRPTIDVLTIR